MFFHYNRVIVRQNAWFKNNGKNQEVNYWLIISKPNTVSRNPLWKLASNQSTIINNRLRNTYYAPWFTNLNWLLNLQHSDSHKCTTATQYKERNWFLFVSCIGIELGLLLSRYLSHWPRKTSQFDVMNSAYIKEISEFEFLLHFLTQKVVRSKLNNSHN